MADFLLEIGSEEIPDWMIEPALADLRAKFEAAFASFGGSAISVDATPRRLMLMAKDLTERAEDVESVVTGPYLSAGVKAAEGFARKWQTSVDKLAKMTEAKGDRYIFHQLTEGRVLAEALAEQLPSLIVNIQFPKTMFWTGSEGARYIRPIRWIVALLGDQVVPFTAAGVESGDATRGHRIIGSQKPLPVKAATYSKILRDNGVILSSEERKRRIEANLGPGVDKDEDLLNTVAYLTEFPSVIRGRFDASYLELPREVLSTVMRHHQRYFSVFCDDGSLAPEFVAVTNTNGDPDGLIQRGNERVLRARFNDAKFFWASDQRKKLADRLSDLSKVTFQAKLGNYHEKTMRVVALTTNLASQTGASLPVAERAALLAKCDLTTDMVKEFTELQGIVGGLYAEAQGEAAGVARAIYQHYKPLGMEDSVPDTVEGQTVSLADKLDTLCECFRIGLIPTGSKDPFALRRAAQGVIKILFVTKLPVRLFDLVAGVPGLPDFLKERVQFYLRDVLNFAYDEVNAVLATEISTLSDAADRVRAIHEIRPTQDFEPVAASFKRIKNILRQAHWVENTEPDQRLFVEGHENELYSAFLVVRRGIKSAVKYREKLQGMASLRPYVDSFFDRILVNDSDQTLRRNRLALLNALLSEFANIADFSEIVTQGDLV